MGPSLGLPMVAQTIGAQRDLNRTLGSSQPYRIQVQPTQNIFNMFIVGLGMLLFFES